MKEKGREVQRREGKKDNDEEEEENEEEEIEKNYKKGKICISTDFIL